VYTGKYSHQYYLIFLGVDAFSNSMSFDLRDVFSNILSSNSIVVIIFNYCMPSYTTYQHYL
jgi:hypothetical protein